MGRWTREALAIATALALVLSTGGETAAKKDKAKDKKTNDPYADLVWPPPPATPRIKLDQVISGRADVEAKSGFRRKLLAGSPQSKYDTFAKLHAVDFDPQGRILVTDAGNAAVIRIDRAGRAMDVLGTRGAVTLKLPLGLDVSADGVIYVADGGNHWVAAFDSEGKVAGVYGQKGELTNPTDTAVTADGKRLYVADSQGHKVVVFDTETGAVVDRIGTHGEGDGEFNFPSALDIGPEGQVFVVDQLNCRVQVFDADGEYVDQFGERGQTGGTFARPKDVAVDEVGLVYVTDNAFNNVQIFDIDFAFLAFVGQGGTQPGQFRGASGVAVNGEDFAVVDQLGARLQLFRFLVSKSE